MGGLGLAFIWRDVPSQAIVQGARLAEEAGYDSVWVAEAWGREAFSLLGAVAVSTRRLRLGTAVVNVFSRSPALLAMAAATVDELSEGRAVLGLGTSSPYLIQDWHSLRYSRPLGRMREATAIIRKALAGERIDFSGESFHTQRFRLAFRSTRGRIPIYFAALGPRMLELGGEIADGVLLYFSPLSRLDRTLAHVRAGAGRAARDVDSVDIGYCIPTVVAEDRTDARMKAREIIAYYVGGMGDYYHRILARAGYQGLVDEVRRDWAAGQREAAARQVSDEMVDELTIAGTPCEVGDQLQKFREAGVTSPLLTLAAPGKDALASVRMIVEALPA